MHLVRSTAAFLLFASLAQSGFAGDMTDAELLKLFQNQRDAFVAAQQSGTGQTRGLTLVTINPSQPLTDAPSLGAPQGNAVATTLSAGDDTVAIQSDAVQPTQPLVDKAATLDTGSVPVQPVVFGDLAPEMQVNLNIQFPFDSATLTPDQKPTLTQTCKVMKTSDIKLFRIVGHTDASGTAEYNLKLSQLRAEEVQRYLVNDCGIDSTRLEALGTGEQFLSNEDNPKAPENRRVEFQALS